MIPESRILFVSASSIETGAIASYHLRSRVEPVRNCRNIGKPDMKLNDTMPKMHVDPESYVVKADGVKCEAEPADTLPLTQAYYVY